MIADNQTDQEIETGSVLFVISSDADRSGTLAARVINYLGDEEIPFRFNKSSRNLMVHGIGERIRFLTYNNHLQHDLAGAEGAVISDDVDDGVDRANFHARLEVIEDDLLDYVREHASSE